MPVAEKGSVSVRSATGQDKFTLGGHFEPNLTSQMSVLSPFSGMIGKLIFMPFI